MKNNLRMTLGLIILGCFGGIHGAALAPEKTVLIDEDKELLCKYLNTYSHLGNLEKVQYLLSMGADINCEIEGPTEEQARQLLQEGMKKEDMVRLQLMIGTPLFAAINAKKGDMAKYLIEHGADVNKPYKKISPLMAAALYFPDTALVKFLLDSGANPNYFVSDNKVSERATIPRSVLEAALLQDNFQLITFIIEESKIKIAPELMTKPVCHALIGGNRPFVRYLIEKGADITSPCFEDFQDNLIMLATQRGDEDTVRLLLDTLKKTLPNKYPTAALLLAGQEIVPESEQIVPALSLPPDVVFTVVKPITENFIDPKIIDARNVFGHTALWYARHGDNPNAVIEKMLLDAGASTEGAPTGAVVRLF